MPFSTKNEKPMEKLIQMDIKSNLVKDEKKKSGHDCFKKLEKMDDFCQKEYIFYTERERVQRLILNSKG